MDPALWELYEAGSPGDEVSVILRLEDQAEVPKNVRLVSQFGPIATGRVRRGELLDVREDESVASLKAPRPVWTPIGETGDSGLEEQESLLDAPERSRATLPALREDGAGVLVGICDWGFDFTHPNFRNADGSTRLRALWDQRGGRHALSPEPFRYGRLFTREAVNRALAAPDPFAALEYHPASGDPTNTGSHGTHVADIVAGNRREPGSEVGLASGSEIAFVHLATQRARELDNLGDSVGLLEGLDFIRRAAEGGPCVLHLSAGKTAGPHRGNTPVELAVDAMMLAQPGLALVQSAGNYGSAGLHTHLRVGPNRSCTLDWLIARRDRTPNEIELWYSGQDILDVTLTSPDGRTFSAALGQNVPLVVDGQAWGNLYHRRSEPNSGLNHIDVFLYVEARPGRWRVTLHGREVVDGRVHAWIERDVGGRHQSRFPRAIATSRYTTNTICNSFRSIAVGAYDATRPDRPAAPFSSRGPTADGRQKPELAAPGFRIRAARSTPRGGWRGEPKLCVKSGTSMAAPWVSGTVALMMQAAGRLLTIHEIRRILVGTLDPHGGPSGRSSTRLGYGYLNVAAAVEAARRIGRGEPVPTPDLPLPLAPLEDVFSARDSESATEPEAEWIAGGTEAAEPAGRDETAGTLLDLEDDAGGDCAWSGDDAEAIEASGTWRVGGNRGEPGATSTRTTWSEAALDVDPDDESDGLLLPEERDAESIDLQELAETIVAAEHDR